MPASPQTDEIGRVVGGRYRLVAALGVGPHGQVFLADDVRLRRRVAVKLLPAALAEEPGFVERFHIEMQAASALRHPHVLVVHDWGTEGGLHLVTEYLDGGSLRDLLDRGVTFSPAQALLVGLAAARAIEFAHANGVVHRDLKPANLLFADDGRLRIGDFGLARTFAEAAWTEPLGAAGTSTRYVSPEQAQGRSVDGRADVYSLALVLIEAVTGHVPFVADTAIGTLMARVGSPLEVPAGLGALAGPLTRAGIDDPAHRIDASGLVTALMAVAGDLPEPEPLPISPDEHPGPAEPEYEDDTLVVSRDELATLAATMSEAGTEEIEAGENWGPPAAESAAEPDVGPDVGPDVEPWIAAGSVRARASGGAAVTTPEPARASALAASGAAPETTSASSGGDATLPPEDEPVAADDEVRRRNRRRWRTAWIALVVILVVGGGVVGALIVRANRTPTHPVPAVAGTAPDAAAKQLRALGFEVATVVVRRDGTTKGELLGTRPPAGSSVEEGRTVTLVVSGGQTLVTLPTDLVGAATAAATARLGAMGLDVQTPQESYSETAAEGTVIGYVPGTPKRLEKGSPVTFVASKGPEPRTIPDPAGQTPAQVEAQLTQMGLVPERTERFDTKVDKGGLIGLDPASGTQVPRGSKVTVIVSKGLLVKVPSLDGVKTVKGAIAKLEDAGLVAGRAEGSGSLSGKPVAFDPPAGQLVEKGSTVNIIVR